MNVLIFDDSIFIIKLLSTTLKESVKELSLFTSQSFDEAVKVVNQNVIDIAFIDLKMPGIMNGADFIFYLNNHIQFKDIRKVVLTETHPNSILRRSYENTVDKYLFKEDVFKEFNLILDQLNIIKSMQHSSRHHDYSDNKYHG